MAALEVQFHVPKGSHGHVLQTRKCSEPSPDPGVGVSRAESGSYDRLAARDQ